MDEIIAKLFTEQSIDTALFASTFILFIWKGIPYILKKFDDLQVSHAQMQKDLLDAHAESQKRQQNLFESSIQKLTDTFVWSINQSKIYHEAHSKDLREIKTILQAKYQSKSE
jgi:hypothetical protein